MSAEPTASILHVSTKTVPLVRFESSFVSVTEGQSGTRSAMFTVALTEAATGTVRVSFSTANGSATAGEDYTARSGTLTFKPGETQKVVGVQIKGDRAPEADESFYLDLHSVTGQAILPPSGSMATGTILNDDALALPLIRFVADSVVVYEGHTGTRAMLFTVTLSSAVEAPVRVTFGTSNGSAQAGVDYMARSGQVVFQPGQTEASFGVRVLGDLAHEPDETFYIDLLSVTGPAMLDTAHAAATGMILNDDTTTLPSVRMQASTVASQEGQARTQIVSFTVELSAAAIDTVRVDFATANGSARAAEDYVARAGVLTFLAGETRKVVGVHIKGDSLFEADETFYLDLVSVRGPALLDISRGTTIALIVDDDPPPAALFAADSVW